MKKRFFIFVFILFFRQGFCASGLSYTFPGGGTGLPQLKTGSKNYSTNFMTKLKYIAAMIGSYYSYQKDFDPRVRIPIAVQVGTYYDLVLFGFQNSNFYSWSGYCYNSGSNVITYYMYCAYNSCKSYIPLSKQNDNSANFWCSQSNFPIVATSNFANLLSVPGRLQTAGLYSGIPQNFNYPVYGYANSGQIRDFYASSLSPVVYSSTDAILGSYSLIDRKNYFLSLSTDVPVWSDSQIENVFSNENFYRDLPMVLPGPGDVVSDSSGTIIYSTSIYYTYISTTIVNIDLSTTNLLLTQIRDRVDFSTITSLLSGIRDKISTSPVNVDLSTTNQKIDNIYNFLSSSTYVSTDTIIIDTASQSIIYQTTSTIWMIYDDIKNFFSVTFPSSTIWDCHFDFGQISFLNKNFILGDYDLCSDPPQGLGLGKYFNFLKAIIRLFFVAISIEIMIRGWIT